MNAATCVILINGILEEEATLRARLASLGSPCIIGCDGGARHAAALGLAIDVVVGDLDSLTAEECAALRAAGAHFEVSPPAKDETDLELALLYAARQGTERIILLGALGGRIDMSLANLFLLAHPGLRHLNVRIWHGSQTTWLLQPPGGDLTGDIGDTISLIPIGGPAQHITTEGLAYPLSDESLEIGPARGLSNVMQQPQARVHFTEGLLLCVHTPGRA